VNAGAFSLSAEDRGNPAAQQLSASARGGFSVMFGGVLPMLSPGILSLVSINAIVLICVCPAPLSVANQNINA
jgi:hypothetical protein